MPDKEPHNENQFQSPEAQIPGPKPPEAQIPRPQPSDDDAEDGTEFEAFYLDEPHNERDRDAPGSLVSPSGRTKTNSGGHIIFTELARNAGEDPENFALNYGVSLAKKQISFYATSRQTAGAVPLRRYMDRNLTILYLKPLFKKYPSLRVQVRKQCDLKLTKDSKGRECVVLALATGLEKPIRRRQKPAEA